MCVPSGPRAQSRWQSALHLAPTWDVVFLEDCKVLLSDPFNIFQGDVVDLAADAFHRVLGCSRDVGPTLPPKVLQAVLKKSPRQDTDGQRASVGLAVELLWGY